MLEVVLKAESKVVVAVMLDMGCDVCERTMGVANDPVSGRAGGWEAATPFCK